MKRDGTRDFHEARWDEPILMELGEPGQRALLLEEIEPQVAQAAGAPDDLVPQGYLRCLLFSFPSHQTLHVTAGPGHHHSYAVCPASQII